MVECRGHPGTDCGQSRRRARPRHSGPRHNRTKGYARASLAETSAGKPSDTTGTDTKKRNRGGIMFGTLWGLAVRYHRIRQMPEGLPAGRLSRSTRHLLDMSPDPNLARIVQCNGQDHRVAQKFIVAKGINQSLRDSCHIPHVIYCRVFWQITAFRGTFTRPGGNCILDHGKFLIQSPPCI